MWRPETVQNRRREQYTGYRKQHDSYVEKKDKTYTENIIQEPETERTIGRPVSNLTMKNVLISCC
jgi:hypothetical protein